jgi:hypothetical protein
MSSYAIASYPDAKEITRLLDDLIKKPIYSIRRDVLEEYEREYFDKKCWKSKEMINVAKELIPGGVQHNLAFNHPFPLVIEKAQFRLLRLIFLLLGLSWHPHCNFSTFWKTRSNRSKISGSISSW